MQTKTPSPNILLSVVLPCYNESATVEKTVQAVHRALKPIAPHYEVIAVDDGSPDQTAVVLQSLAALDQRVTAICNAQNAGKGAAVRTGVLRSEGQFVAFIDADGEIDPQQLLPYLGCAINGIDLVVASKQHSQSNVSRSLKRRIFSWGWKRLTYGLFGIQVADTQVGLKLFTHDLAQQIFPLLRSQSMSFDLELLWAASHMGYSILELPVDINMLESRSSVTVRRIGRMMWEVVKLRIKGINKNHERVLEPAQ